MRPKWNHIGWYPRNTPLREYLVECATLVEEKGVLKWRYKSVDLLEET